jgi:TonB family protein
MDNEILTYLFKVSLGVSIVSISYLLLRNDSNLVIKRFYLLFGIIASWIFPILPFPRLIDFSGTGPIAIPGSSVTVESAGSAAAASAPSSFHFNWFNILIMIYSAGVLIILLRNVILISRWKMRHSNHNTGSNIVFTDKEQVFTLFSWIFLPEKYRNDPRIEPIILHEKAHINQMHFIDLILVELTVLFTWFNPFTWLISRMIKENHEHLADREVLLQGINPAQYRAQLLNFSLGTTYFRLGHRFNHSLTKTRFKMMKRTATKRIGIIKYLLIIPLITVTLGVFTGSKVQEQDGPVKGKVILGDTGNPADGAAVIIKGTTTGTITDREGRFELKCEKDDILVISYVGYKTIEMKASWITKDPIKMEAKTYEIDLNSVSGEKKVHVDVRIRDQEGDKESPVFIVDGNRIRSIQDIYPGDIESVTVLKDPSSDLVKKYDAQNGIVIIKLREGVVLENKVVTGADDKAEAWDEVKVEAYNKEESFKVVEDMPEFPGGLTALSEYIYDNLEYPEKARQDGIEGKVTVEFIVNEEGEVEDANVFRSTYQGFDEAALKVFRNMPDWKPGSQRGKAVRVKIQVPVEFKLDKE